MSIIDTIDIVNPTDKTDSKTDSINLIDTTDKPNISKSKLFHMKDEIKHHYNINDEEFGKYFNVIKRVYKIRETFYDPGDIKDISLNQFVEVLDLRDIAKICETDTLDLADPKYGLSGKYILDCDFDIYDGEVEHIKIIKNITTLNFKFCKSLDYLFTNFVNLEIIENLENINIDNIIRLCYTFANCRSLLSLDLNNWNTQNVEIIDGTFRDCVSLISLNIDKWNTFNCKSLYSAFSNCKSLTSLNINNWDISNVEILICIFSDCHSLIELDLSNWNISNVMSMQSIFENCKSLVELNLSNWNFTECVSMQYAFRDCKSLQLIDLSNNSNVDEILIAIHKCIKHDITIIYPENYIAKDRKSMNN